MTFFSTSCTVQPAGSAATPAAGTIAATACVPRTAGTATASIRERESRNPGHGQPEFFLI